SRGGRCSDGCGPGEGRAGARDGEGSHDEGGASMTAVVRRLRWAVPYLFLLPGGLWLLLFFVIPMAVMASISLQTGSLGTGYTLTWNFGIYPEAISQFATQFLPSFEYGFIVT